MHIIGRRSVSVLRSLLRWPSVRPFSSGRARVPPVRTYFPFFGPPRARTCSPPLSYNTYHHSNSKSNYYLYYNNNKNITRTQLLQQLDPSPVLRAHEIVHLHCSTLTTAPTVQQQQLLLLLLCLLYTSPSPRDA